MKNESVKKLLAIFLTVALMVSCVIYCIPAMAEEIDGTTIEIRTIEELYNVRDDLTANYKLMNDIDLTAATAKGGDWDFFGNGWNPIGSNDVYGNGEFSGIFDGNGHTIKGMRIEVNRVPSGTGQEVYLGLFANVGGTIKNLTIDGSINFAVDFKCVYCGAFVGNTSGNILNCENKSNITIASKYDSSNCNLYVGGLTGYSCGINDNSSNKGNISLSTGFGRIGVSYAYVSGLIGYLNSGNINGCYSLGDISGITSGGININSVHYYSNVYSSGLCYSNTSTIANSYNTGNVTANSSGIDSYIYSSGLCYSTDSIITNSYNTGNVFANGKGYNYSFVQSAGIECGSATVSKCYNRGKINGGDNYGIGLGTLTNCYYLADTGTTSSGATSLTPVQMKTESMYRGFDFENTWVLDPYVNYPYPQLKDNIQDLSPAVELVRLVALPQKLDYISGEALDLTGGMLEIVYKSGKSEMKLLTDDMITGFDTENVGEQELTVTYGGKSDTFNVYVDPAPTLTGIRLYSEPDTSDFVIGTAFDFTGAKIERIYDNNTTDIIPITEDMVSGGNINHLGKYTITVSYKGFETSFRVTVSGLTLEGIRLDSLPNKTVYKAGEEFNPNGIAVTAIYSGTVEKTIETGYEFSGFSSETGEHTVTVTYLGKTASFIIEVVDPFAFELTSASITLTDNIAVNFKAPAVLTENFSDIKLSVTMNNKATVIESYEIVKDSIVFKFDNIAPDKMNDSIDAVLSGTYNGKEYTSKIEGYSVGAYCYNMLSKTNDNALKTLLVDILNYGSAAQIYNNYNTANLVNSKLTAEQKGFASQDESVASILNTKYAVAQNPEVEWLGAGLRLVDSIKIRFVMQAESIQGISVRVFGSQFDTEITSDKFEKVEGTNNQYYVVFDEINAAQLSSEVLICAYKGGNIASDTVLYSVESYVAEMKDCGNQNLVELLNAIMRYGRSACNYIG